MTLISTWSASHASDLAVRDITGKRGSSSAPAHARRSRRRRVPAHGLETWSSSFPTERRPGARRDGDSLTCHPPLIRRPAGRRSRRARCAPTAGGCRHCSPPSASSPGWPTPWSAPSCRSGTSCRSTTTSRRSTRRASRPGCVAAGRALRPLPAGRGRSCRTRR